MKLVIDLIEFYEKDELTMIQIKEVIDFSHKGASYEECCVKIDELRMQSSLDRLHNIKQELLEDKRKEKLRQ